MAEEGKGGDCDWRLGSNEEFDEALDAHEDLDPEPANAPAHRDRALPWSSRTEGDDENAAIHGYELDSGGFERGATADNTPGSGLDRWWRNNASRQRRDNFNRYQRRKKLAGTNLECFSDDDDDGAGEMEDFIVGEDGDELSAGAHDDADQHSDAMVAPSVKPRRLDDDEEEEDEEKNDNDSDEDTPNKRYRAHADAMDSDEGNAAPSHKRPKRSSLRRADGSVPTKADTSDDTPLMQPPHAAQPTQSLPAHDDTNTRSTSAHALNSPDGKYRSPLYNTRSRRRSHATPQHPQQEQLRKRKRRLDDDDNSEHSEEYQVCDEENEQPLSQKRRLIRGRGKAISTPPSQLVQALDTPEDAPPSNTRSRKSQRRSTKRATQRDALSRLQASKSPAQSLNERLELAGAAQSSSENEDGDEEEGTRGPEIAVDDEEDDNGFLVPDEKPGAAEEEHDIAAQHDTEKASAGFDLEEDLPGIAARKARSLAGGTEISDFLLYCARNGFPDAALASAQEFKRSAPSLATNATGELLANGFPDAALELLRLHNAERYSLKWRCKQSGETLAHRAAASGHATSVKAIAELARKVTSGFDKFSDFLRARDTAQATPLMLAAGAGGMGGVEEVLRQLGHHARQSLYEYDNDKRIPLHYAGALKYFFFWLRNMFFSCYTFRLPFRLLAANVGHESCIRFLVGRDQNTLYSKDSQGATPLHHASLYGHTTAVRALVECGAPVSVPDESGFPALLYADFASRRNCVLTLLTAETDTQLIEMSNLMRKSETARPRVVSVMKMLAEIPEYYKALNSFVERHLHLLSGSLSFLLNRSSILSFQTRREWLKMQVQQDSGIRDQYARTDMVTAENLDDLTYLCAHSWLTPTMLRSAPLWLRLFNPSAPDSHGPGVEREFLGRICQNAVQRGLLVEVEASTRSYALNPTEPDEDAAFTLGLMLAYAVRQQSHLPLSLAPTALRALQGRHLTEADLEAEDPQLFTSLRHIEEMNDPSQLYLTFEEVEAGSERKEVNNSNKHEYKSKVIKQKLNQYKHQYVRSCNGNAFANGVHSLLEKRLLMPFSTGELSMLIGGTAEVDTSEWQAFTTYEGYDPERDAQPAWLWRTIKTALSEEEKLLLLKFATGNSRLPPGGFGEIATGSQSAFVVCRVEADDDDKTLPQASTCTHRLKLPAYKSEQALRERLLVALRHGSEGFVFT